MTFWLPQLAPLAVSVTGTMTCAGPPDDLTFMSLPAAKNPSELPSGDQNGCLAPSVPTMAVASSASSDLTNRRGLLSPLTAVNAIRPPSGR